MTRKHFIALAALVNDLVSTTSDPTQAVDIAVRDFADNLATFCASTNPNFDRARFLDACGFGE